MPLLLVALALLISTPAYAQQYPAKAVRIVVPFPAGGGVDATARTVGQKLAEQLTYPVIVENRPGAISVATLVFSKLPYVPTRDLAPVSTLVTMPYILVTHPSLPVRSARDLIALAKANPGKLNMASGGAGTGQHLAGELFNMMAG